jgi:hypothetical protein
MTTGKILYLEVRSQPGLSVDWQARCPQGPRCPFRKFVTICYYQPRTYGTDIWISGRFLSDGTGSGTVRARSIGGPESLGGSRSSPECGDVPGIGPGEEVEISAQERVVGLIREKRSTVMPTAGTSS